jgi:hypothetical protein|tara:strand:- start:1348 stop:2478 length:1131 start_codon:yes stop_codon:yes gene_type:complete
MATFQVQVEGLTSLSVDTGELTEFLNDGVIDVTTRWLSVKPQDVERFSRRSALTTSQGYDSGGSTILNVIRESGTADDWRKCRKIATGLQGRVVDVDSLHFASKFNPAFTVEDDGKIYVYPTPDVSPNGYKVYFVNSSPIDGDGNPLTHADSTIGSFPNDKVYLVVIYAGIKSLQAALGAINISTFSLTAVNTASVPSVPAISGGSVSAITIAALPAAPTYVKPVQSFDITQLETFLETEEDSELAQIQLGRLQYEISKYQANIQNELNNFNEANTLYQAGIQRNLQQAQLDMQDAQKEADLTLQASIQDYTLELQRLSADVQKYSAKVGAEVQAYQQEVAEKSAEYQWMTARIKDLKEEYDKTFMIAAPKQQAKA